MKKLNYFFKYLALIFAVYCIVSIGIDMITGEIVDIKKMALRGIAVSALFSIILVASNQMKYSKEKEKDATS